LTGLNEIQLLFLRWEGSSIINSVIPVCISCKGHVTSVCLSTHTFWCGCYWTDLRKIWDLYESLSRKSKFG